MLIDGEWVEGRSGRALEVRNPFNQTILANLPVAESADLDRALNASQRGFAVWRDTPAIARQKVIETTAQLLEDRLEDIATSLTKEMGKPIRESRMEVEASIAVLRWYGEEGKRAYGRIVPPQVPGMVHKVVCDPIGPAIAFVSWNFPALNVMRKVAGALAAGCSIIIKPSEETPFTAIAIAEAFQNAGLPAGVLNVVFGDADAISRHLCSSSIPRKLSFTGSVPIGKHLIKLASENLIRCTMELGGHAPFIVFDDADVSLAAELLVAGKFRNAGQVCVAPSRFFVQQGVYEEFIDRVRNRVVHLNIGDGLSESCDIGPLINQRRVESMQALLDDCNAQGAEIVWQGIVPVGDGAFFPPTIVRDVPLSARIMHEEPFGPIAPIVQFEAADEAIELANMLPFGLSAYLFTSDASTSTLLSRRIDAGMLAVNSLHIAAPETPFGGVKHSGFGSEGGLEGLESYLVTRTVSEIF